MHTITLGFAAPVDTRKADVSSTDEGLMVALVSRGRFSSIAISDRSQRERLYIASVYRRAQNVEKTNLKVIRLDSIRSRGCTLRIISECCRNLVTERLVIGEVFSRIFTLAEMNYLGWLVQFSQSNSRTVEFSDLNF